MHDEELIVSVKIGLRFSRDGALIETGYDLCKLLDAKSNEPVAQIVERFALGGPGKFIALKNRPGIDSRVHVMDGNADWNLSEQGPLRAAHAANFRQQAEVHVQDSERRYFQQLPSQNIAAGEDDQVGRPFSEKRDRIRRILLIADCNGEAMNRAYLAQAAENTISMS